MRGFTMFLVVLSHVGTFGMGLYGTDTPSYHKIFAEFRMPLFFFVSGFVLYKAGFTWSMANTWKFFKKKINVQIFSPLIFLAASVYIRNLNFTDALFNYQKSGYWFTFTLFEYFIFYIVLNQLLDILRVKGDGLIRDIVLIGCGFCAYIATVPTVLNILNIPESVNGLLGIPTWGYFLFFIIGTRIRKYFAAFEHMLDNTPLVLLSIIVFFGFNIYSDKVIGLSSTGFNLCTALSGLVLIFALFRKNQVTFSKDRKTGRILQYIGRRTLDIYLIHYFFIYSHLSVALPDFGAMNSPFLEFVCSVIVTVFVIMACLAVSEVLRLSPTLAHFLFGQKKTIKN